MLTPDRSQQVIQLCQELIQRQSYSGQEGSVVERMKQAFHQWRFDETVVDSYGNILGRIKGKRPGKVLLLDGHIDTVPVPDPSRWTHNPYGGEIAEGRIYGRGSSDMKGAVAAMVAAAASSRRTPIETSPAASMSPEWSRRNTLKASLPGKSASAFTPTTSSSANPPR